MTGTVTPNTARTSSTAPLPPGAPSRRRTQFPRTRKDAAVMVGRWAVGGAASALLLLAVRPAAEVPGLLDGSSAWRRFAATRAPAEVVAAAAWPVAVALLAATVTAVLGAGAALALATRGGRRRHLLDRAPVFVTLVAAALGALAGPAGAVTDSGAATPGDPADRPVVEVVVGGGTRAARTERPTSTATSAPTATVPAPPAPRPTPPTTTAAADVRAAPPSTALRPAVPPSPAPLASVPSTTSVPAPSRPTTPTAPGPATEPATGATVEVRPGDHLWAIAARTVTLRSGAAASTDDVARYWWRLVEANRDRLVDPDDPSLVMPGQRLRLP